MKTKLVYYTISIKSLFYLGLDKIRLFIELDAIAINITFDHCDYCVVKFVQDTLNL